MTDTLGYVRVSTDQQATEQKTSLGDQRRAITDLATRLGRVLDPQNIFEDAGVSGATAEGRPAFMAMLRYCEGHSRPRHKSGTIVILNDSRFGRFDDPEESGHWRFVFKQLGWFVRFAEGDEVQDTLARGVIRFLGSAEASTYRANLRRRAKQAARSNAERGHWQQEAPYGYRRLATRVDGAQRVLAIGQRKSADEVSRLTPGPELEQSIVRFLFEEYAMGGVGFHSLAKHALERHPSKKWSNQVVRSILHNPAYAGDLVWCRRVTDKTERQERKVRDRSEWVVVRDAHPSLVSRELWESVQRRMVSNKRDTTATQGGYPLSGLIRCKQCDNHFAGGGGRKGPPGDVDRYRFYKDTGCVKRVPECGPPMVTLRKRWLEREVIEAIIEHASDPETRRLFEEELPNIIATSGDGDRKRVGELEKELGQLLKQRKRLVDAIAMGTLAEQEAATTLAELRARISGIEAECERLKFSARARAPISEELKRARAVTADYENQIRRASGASLRRIVLPWIADAWVDKVQRVLVLSLWVLPGINRVFRLGVSPELVTQEKALVRRLTTQRRIKIPYQKAALARWCADRHKVKA